MLYLPNARLDGEYFTIQYHRETLFEITCTQTGRILKQGEYLVLKYEPLAEEGDRVSILAKEYIPRQLRAPGVFQKREVSLIPQKIDTGKLSGYFFTKELQIFGQTDILPLQIEWEIEQMALFAQTLHVN